jgi:hypothetical protein
MRPAWKSVAYANSTEGSECTRALRAILDLGEPALALAVKVGRFFKC